MSLPRRSQSALEYMMTYGWAILVIVIVAAVLYSLGIFSPSSSLSTTITGFSNLGTVNAVCLGGTSFTISMGDSTGYPINITQINLTSSSGKTTYSPNILIQPNSIQTVTVPSSSLCSPGARYSVSAVISYLEPGQIFPGPYTSTGTVAGTAASPPSSATSYEPLTITNSQNQGTPTPFQQMINVTSSSPGWADISSSPFGQNVEFFSATGQILDSWLENYTSAHAIWWVKLTSSIPVGSKQIIYMGFAPTSTNLFNTNNVGEAPQLSSTYAEYDDGANTFLYYQRFGGLSSLPNNWSSISGTVITYYPMYIEVAAITSSTWYGIYMNPIPSSLSSSTTVWEYYGNEYDSKIAGSAVGIGIGSTNEISYGFLEGDNPPNLVFLDNNNNGFSINTGYYDTNDSKIYTMEIVSGKDVNMYVNYKQIYSTTSATSASPTYFVIQSSNNGGTLSSPITIEWFRLRAYPPNGVMPSVSFGSVS